MSDGEKAAESGDPGAAGSAKVSCESSRLPGSSVRRKTEKKEGASLPIHRFLGPSPPTVLGGSAGSRGAWPPEFGGGFVAEVPGVTPNRGCIMRCHQWRRRRGGWSMALGVRRGQDARMVLRSRSPLVSSLLGPAPKSRLTPARGDGPCPSGWHVRMTRVAEGRRNTLRCQTP